MLFRQPLRVNHTLVLGHVVLTEQQPAKVPWTNVFRPASTQSIFQPHRTAEDNIRCLWCKYSIVLKRQLWLCLCLLRRATVAISLLVTLTRPWLARLSSRLLTTCQPVSTTVFFGILQFNFVTLTQWSLFGGCGSLGRSLWLTMCEIHCAPPFKI